MRVGNISTFFLDIMENHFAKKCSGLLAVRSSVAVFSPEKPMYSVALGACHQRC